MRVDFNVEEFEARMARSEVTAIDSSAFDDLIADDAGLIYLFADGRLLAVVGPKGIRGVEA